MSLRWVVASLGLAAALSPAGAQEAPRADGAAQAAGRSASDLDALVVRLADADAVARKDAATRLGAMGPASAAASPALLELVSDPDPGVRAAARKALGDLAARGLADVTAYLEGVRSPGPARDAWIDVERSLSTLGLALTPGDVAFEFQRARRLKGDAAAHRERALFAWCAAHATWGDPVRPLHALPVVRAAARTAGDAARPLALAALAVIGRAELVQRRCEGDASDLPAADDAKAVARTAALLDPAAKTDQEVRASFERTVPALLVRAYGCADGALLGRIAGLGESDGAMVALGCVETANLGGLGRPASAIAADMDMMETPERVHQYVASLWVRGDEAEKAFAAVRKSLLDPPDLRRNVAGVLLALRFHPRDPEAGPKLFTTLTLLGADREGDVSGRERLRLLGVLTSWIPRLPDPPPGMASGIFGGLRIDGDPESQERVAEALVPSIGRDAKLAGYLRRRYLPDEGEPARKLKSEYGRELLADALACSGDVGDALIGEWRRGLDAEAGADPLDRIATLGPVWAIACPERQLRRLAGAGSRARAVVPSVEPYLRSPDPLERYLAAVAMARIGKP